jgi:arylsulfatase A-like enzyme
VVGTENWPYAVQAYLASIAFADAQVGRLLDALDASDKKDNTIIVFWTDHGWHLGEKEHWRKFALWEEATRCPMMISAPGVTSSNSVCDRTVSLLDIYPTLSDLCGLPIRHENEGNSLRPLLEDPATEWDIPAVTTFGRSNHSVRSEKWRYIRYADGSEELYDHEADPLEWTNLADKGYDQVLSDHKRWLPKTNAPEGKRDRT